MRTKLHIVLYLILTGFVCFIVACAPSSEEKSKYFAAEKVISDSAFVSTTDNKDLEDVFETDSLTTEQLQVFQQRAQQKLQDFINYVEIISNKSYNAELRDVAKQQIKNLFTDSTVLINIPITKTQKIPCTVTEFLNEVKVSDYDSIKVKTDSVVLSQPAKSKEGMKYIGTITGKVSIDGFKNGETIFNSSSIQKAETNISKTKKQFGKESKMVWTVTLGELK